MSVVEQYARAHVVTDSPDTPDAIPVVLRYDPSADPLSVCIGLPGPQEWALSRDLLEEGLRAPASRDDISVWPCGRVQAVVEFHSPEGVEVVQFESQTLLRFLRSTYLATTTAH
ncbi:SsgA family sporulation/cell division regulator [Streptomyces sp. NPDC052051]|uniref:SsgA family sporulation/cell division regulator n=1 Tax=Streptomyces sp. NPDC052051 TaxID=3154649 RepID=UPI003433BF17